MKNLCTKKSEDYDEWSRCNTTKIKGKNENNNIEIRIFQRPKEMKRKMKLRLCSQKRGVQSCGQYKHPGDSLNKTFSKSYLHITNLTLELEDKDQPQELNNLKYHDQFKIHKPPQTTKSRYYNSKISPVQLSRKNKTHYSSNSISIFYSFFSESDFGITRSNFHMDLSKKNEEYEQNEKETVLENKEKIAALKKKL